MLCWTCLFLEFGGEEYWHQKVKENRINRLIKVKLVLPEAEFLPTSVATD